MSEFRLHARRFVAAVGFAMMSIATAFAQVDFDTFRVLGLPGVQPDFRSVIAIDLDRDGNLDLVVSDRVDPVVAIWLSDGTGGYFDARLLPAGDSPFALAGGDFDEDGKIDLVVTDTVNNAALLFLGDGEGGFAAPRSFAAGSTPRRAMWSPATSTVTGGSISS